MFQQNQLWTPDEDSIMCEFWRKIPIRELQHKLGRSQSAIKQRAYQLDLLVKQRCKMEGFVEAFTLDAQTRTTSELMAMYNISRSTVLRQKERHGVVSFQRPFARFSVHVVCDTLPAYATPGSAGVDLMTSGDYAIRPRECVKVRTGFQIAIPPGYEGQLRARSGLAFKYKLTLMNGVGTIDSDYREEVCVLLVNHGEEVVHLKKGQRIAQMVFAQTARFNFIKVNALSASKRQGGFGSTGTQ